MLLSFQATALNCFRQLLEQVIFRAWNLKTLTKLITLKIYT